MNHEINLITEILFSYSLEKIQVCTISPRYIVRGLTVSFSTEIMHVV